MANEADSATLQDKPGRAEIDSALYQLLQDYNEQVVSLFDLVAALMPHVVLMDAASTVGEDLGTRLAKLPAEGRAGFLEVMEELGREVGPSEVLNRVREKFSDEPWGGRLIVELHTAFRRKPRSPIVLNAVVVTAVSAFETMLAGLVSAFYRAAPEALEAVPRDREREFSLKDLKGMTSVQEAIDLAISRRVDDLLFGGLSDWKRFFKDNLKVDFADHALDWPRAVEVFQRRHCIVHNGGRASPRYINSVAGSADRLQVGDVLLADEAYVESALDDLTTLGTLLIFSVWLKFRSHERTPHALLADASYRALMRQRWVVASALAQYGLKNATQQADQSLFLVNDSIALKALGKSTPDLVAWDTSALSTRFRMAKHCLMEEYDEAFTLLETSVLERDISLEYLEEWPLLARMREDARFAALLEKAKALEEADVETLFMAEGRRTYHVKGCKRVPAKARVVTRAQVVERDGAPCGSCRPKDVRLVEAVAKGAATP